MKAIVYEKFGPPEVLQLKEVATPQPAANEIRIKIYATTVTAEDPDTRKTPGLNGLRKPKKAILGWYLAGDVQAVGRAVTRFEVGDPVYGSAGVGYGTYAEYICLPEGAALARKPANLTYEEAAAIPNGGLTALPFLRDKGKVQKGQKVLINGASGSVGTSGVQFAKYYGAEATGVCSTANVDLVRSLGADFVIDYTQEDFTKNGQIYDIIFDAVGKSTYSRCKDSLTPNGIYLTTIPDPAALLQMGLTALGRGKKVIFAATGLRSSRDKAKDLAFIADIVEAGHIKPVIDRRYSLEQMAEAHRYVETGRKKGDVVITVVQPENEPA